MRVKEVSVEQRPGDAKADVRSDSRRGVWELVLTAMLAGVRPDESASYKESFRAALSRPISRRRALALRFSAMLQALLVLQVGTGVIAALYYRPSVEGALSSVHGLEATPTGWLVRQLHVWSGRCVLVLAILMFARYIAVATYKRRGRLKWAAAFLMLPVLWTFYATGALLPFDANAIGATKTLALTIGHLPLFGPFLETFLSGPSVDSPELHSRMWVIHVVLLPWILFFILLLVFSVFSRPKSMGSGAPSVPSAPPLWPHRTLDVAVAVTAALGIVFVLALIWPADLNGAAAASPVATAVDPVFRPFTGFQSIMVNILGDWGAVTALSILFAFFVALFFLPWLDRGPETTLSRRRWLVLPFMFCLLALIALMLFGEGLP